MASKRKPASRTIAPADAALFREAIGSVRPILAPERVQPPPPAPIPRQRLADEAEALQGSRKVPVQGDLMDGTEPLSFRREHVAPRLLSGLKRGQFVVEDELDLHQMTASAARASLRRFVAEAHRDGLACVCIVHGKGRRSEAGVPVLRPLVAEWLTQRADVLAFASAPPALGGTGALLVLLDRKRR